jgi:hypothetical protein
MHGRNAYKILIGNPEWKKPPMRYRHTQKESMKTDLKERWSAFIWLKIRSSDLVKKNLLFGSPRRRNFLHRLSDYQLINDSAPCS